MFVLATLATTSFVFCCLTSCFATTGVATVDDCSTGDGVDDLVADLTFFKK